MAEIWQFTFRQWGPQQADRYLAQIGDAIEFLRANPGAGNADRIGDKAFQRWRIESHVILYRSYRGDLSILRILHVRQDVPRHLS